MESQIAHKMKAEMLIRIAWVECFGWRNTE
jgi:hypothetical protein